MKPYIMIPIIIYYIIVAIVMSGTINSPISEEKGYNNTIDIDSIDVSDGSGFDALRFLGILFFGVGLPGDVPGFVSFAFVFWQTLVTICFVISLF